MHDFKGGGTNIRKELNRKKNGLDLYQVEKRPGMIMYVDCFALSMTSVNVLATLLVAFIALLFSENSM